MKKGKLVRCKGGARNDGKSDQERDEVDSSMGFNKNDIEKNKNNGDEERYPGAKGKENGIQGNVT